MVRPSTGMRSAGFCSKEPVVGPPCNPPVKGDVNIVYLYAQQHESAFSRSVVPPLEISRMTSATIEICMRAAESPAMFLQSTDSRSPERVDTEEKAWPGIMLVGKPKQNLLV